MRFLCKKNQIYPEGILPKTLKTFQPFYAVQAIKIKTPEME